MSFQDRGAPSPFMKETDGAFDPSSIPPNHRFLEQNSSHNSFAIMAGKFGKRSSRIGGRRASTESTKPLKANKADISRPLELSAMRDMSAVEGSPRHEMPADDSQNPDKKRSSGWSRYFAPTQPQLPSAYHQSQQSTKSLSTYTSDSHPDIPSSIRDSQLVPPLDFSRREDGERMSRVMTGSPAFNHSADDLARRGSSLDAARGQRAHLSNGTAEDDYSQTLSHGSFLSDGQSFSESTFSTLSHHMRGSSEYLPQDRSNQSWTPVSTHNMKPTVDTGLNPGHIPRPPSSNYTNSVMYDRQSKPYSYARNTSGTGFFPGNRDREALRPSSRQNRVMSPTQSFPAPPASSSSPAPAGNGLLGVPGARPLAADEQENRESTMTVFPRGVPSAYYTSRNGEDRSAAPAKTIPTKTTSDMSWFKLGT